MHPSAIPLGQFILGYHPNFSMHELKWTEINENVEDFGNNQVIYKSRIDIKKNVSVDIYFAIWFKWLFTDLRIRIGFNFKREVFYEWVQNTNI